jgi:cobalt-zinc-cadmium efflux system outer membrane protein
VVALTGARRTVSGVVQPDVVNWSASVSQELEIAGQRGLRREAAAEEITAQERRAVAIERDVAAEALEAYFDAVAASEVDRLAARLETTGRNMAVATRARADSGVASPLEADVAESTALSLARALLAADRDLQATRIRLSTMLGRDPATTLVGVDGELVPLFGADVVARTAAGRAAEQPEVQSLEAERRSFEARASALRRSRIPNPTLQVFAQNDGFDERVYGAGISLPIPLPYPLGRTNKGEIAEAEARAARATTESERRARDIRQRVAVAAKTYESRRLEVAAFTSDRVARAERALADIATEIGAGRLAVRDALVGQQALIELLRGYIDARRALCIASVELARAAGIPLERGAQ